MKYLHQATIIAAITFAAEILRLLIPLPIPASIYGLVGLFLLLKTGLLKLSAIQEVGDLLLELMPLLLMPATISVVSALDTAKAMLLPVLVISFVGTTIVMGVTGRMAQRSIRRRKEGTSHE